MAKTDSWLKLKLPFACLAALVALVLFFDSPVFSLTASLGRPYQGRLINGVPFPTQFPGYYLRDRERAYATPEAIATVLDAIDAVRTRFPDTCNLFIGDFSREGGGWLNMHRSHQNGRDVDLGMYAKGNRSLETFAPMNEETLDVAKTWCFLDSLLRSQHIQYIFLDRRIQRQLHEYALSQGVDPVYLEQVFANGRHSPVQHVGGHYDHMHVRFYTPWSTMAARVSEDDGEQRARIETAQQAYLPQEVNYYVKGSDHSLVELAQSFGVNEKDLCRWNQLKPNEAPNPGSCLVFYKRGFELEPVHLARSVRPDSVADSPGFQLAAAGGSRASGFVSNFGRARLGKAFIPVSATYAGLKTGQKMPLAKGKVAVSSGPNISKPVQTVASVAPNGTKGFAPAVYTTEKQDTLQKIAKQQGIDLDALCKINGLHRNSALKPGQKIRLCDQVTSMKGAGNTSVPAKAGSDSSSKQNTSAPSTLQKNMKPVTGSNVKGGNSPQKVHGAAQKGAANATDAKSDVQLTKAQKAPAKKH